jgi:hypothetical protein
MAAAMAQVADWTESEKVLAGRGAECPVGAFVWNELTKTGAVRVGKTIVRGKDVSGSSSSMAKAENGLDIRRVVRNKWSRKPEKANMRKGSEEKKNISCFRFEGSNREVKVRRRGQEFSEVGRERNNMWDAEDRWKGRGLP